MKIVIYPVSVIGARVSGVLKNKLLKSALVLTFCVFSSCFRTQAVNFVSEFGCCYCCLFAVVFCVVFSLFAC